MEPASKFLEIDLAAAEVEVKKGRGGVSGSLRSEMRLQPPDESNSRQRHRWPVGLTRWLGLSPVIVVHLDKGLVQLGIAHLHPNLHSAQKTSAAYSRFIGPSKKRLGV